MAAPRQREIFTTKDAAHRFDMLEFDDLELHAAVATPSLLEQFHALSTIRFDNPRNYISREEMRDCLRSCAYRPIADGR